MFRKILKIIGSRSRWAANVPIFLMLSAATIAVLSLWPGHSAKLIERSANKASATTSLPTNSSDQQTRATESQSPKVKSSTSTSHSQSPQVPAATGGQNSSTGSTTPPSTPATIEVTLTINDDNKGQISLPAGSNQCDVLQKALDTGKISSLDMHYNSQYKSNAVYIIDGIGDSGSVWWTYKVNGHGPPLGCSLVSANAGDVIKWEYQK